MDRKRGKGYAGAMIKPLPLQDHFRAQDALDSAQRTLTTGRAGIDGLTDALASGPLGAAFGEAVALFSSIKGRVVVTGVGKSGHIASKIAATFASTGTKAFFVHPADANHGDLGMIAREDAILALSWSGESAELQGIVAYARRFGVPLVALTAGDCSALAREAQIVLCLPKVREACPHGLAPTTSTLLQLALGDALADGRVAGIITDGDLRRHIDADLLALPVQEVMTPKPRTISPDTLAASALQELNERAITALIVAEDDYPVGIIHLHDLLRVGAA